jgi:hypothetical protein
MKVILSRKGFDSTYGGYPSPILPNGEMLSLPIPLDDDIRYSDLMTGTSTYYNLMADLNPKIKAKGKWLVLDRETKCHLDPDICQDSIEREPGWKACFGQIDAARRPLEILLDQLFLSLIQYFYDIKYFYCWRLNQFVAVANALHRI